MWELSAAIGGVRLLKDKLAGSGADISGLMKKQSPGLARSLPSFYLETETRLRSEVNMWNPHVFTPGWGWESPWLFIRVSVSTLPS